MKRYVIEILADARVPIRRILADSFIITENNRMQFYRDNEIVASYPEEITIIKDVEDIDE